MRTLSPAGEQFLDLQPRRDGAPYLADGDRISGGRLQTNMLISTGKVCSYGVEDSNPQLDQTERKPLDPDRSCPASFEGQQRGTAHAPGPVR